MSNPPQAGLLSQIDSEHVQSRETPEWWSWLVLGLVHAICLGVFFVGWSWVALAAALGSYMLRMFAISAFYHRFFSHRTYKTHRWAQFVFAMIGCSTCQQGPLFWAANHRHHHQYSDQPEDIHSPRQQGFFHSHIGWIPKQQNAPSKLGLIPDFNKFPELRWLDQNHIVFPFLLGAAMYFLGWGLESLWPSLGTSPLQMLIWGFFVPTVLVWHATFTINSVSHVYGSKRYATDDDSRNNFWFALLTGGEGWHNNHHYYATSVRQGFYWWEIDMTYYVLKAFSKIGLVWDLKYIPAHLKEKHLHKDLDKPIALTD
ncbi:MAG: acyl-CoA desaturase [Candidatus Sericytochromatia bacterium]